MSTLHKLSAEQVELAAVLSSDTFAKSPNLARLLDYLCQKYLRGEAADLKEYNIAVECLGRSTEFDPATNSIVRVEVRRLRDRLKKYYESEGAGHALMIRVEVGSYVPHFIAHLAPVTEIPPAEERDPVVRQAADAPEPGEEMLPAAVPPPIPRYHRQRFALLLLGLCVLVAAGVFTAPLLRKAAQRYRSASRPAPDASAVAVLQGDEVRILAGYSKDKYVDRTGRVWMGDRYFNGGEPVEQGNRFIARTIDPPIYATGRTQEFSYDIPLKPGVYELRLHWAEQMFGPDTYSGGGESSRIFDVLMNGKVLLAYLDVFSAAGGNNIAYTRVLKDVSPASDGYLHLAFHRVKEAPFLNALEILPGVAGKMRPLHLVAQDNSYTDRQGRLWSPDQYFQGGRLANRKVTVTGTDEPGLYAGERFGNFTYAIPVAAGRYTARLYFAETYWGPGNSGFGGERNRVFDVSCNGTALLRNFDIFREAGGGGRALIKSFRGLQPNAAGLLIFTFTPANNYAVINAIEITDESK